ncbi:MAG: efflux transporter outer membrane subunit [Caulobacteraceae bacterium]|nr:efflux transporter outer membrane subunit [Caulobacteraceae bacterium]
MARAFRSLSLCAVLLSGCTMAPAYVRPDAPISASYPGAPEPAGDSIARVGWRSFFADPQLQALIQAALDNNRDLRVAAGRVEAGQASYKIQGAPLLPSLSALGLGLRTGLPSDLSLTGSPTTANFFAGGLSASWELDVWGRLRSQRQSARESYLASEEARRAVVVGLIRQVADRYLLEQEYAERIALADQTIVNRQEALRIARRRYEVGSSSKLPMTQAQTLLGQAQAALQALEQARAQNQDALVLLVGRPTEIPRSPTRLADADFARSLPTGLPSALLVNRPDIMAAEHQLRAAHADIGAARAAYFPDISLMAAGGTASGQLDRLFRAGSGVWSFAPLVTAPIFEGGKLAGNLASAKAERDIALATYEQSIQSAFRDVADALAARRWLGEQVQTTQQTLDALGERARLADLSYANGRATYLEVLEAQRDLFTAQQTLVQLRRAYLASEVDLYAALGGGLSDGSRQNQAGMAR